jgi:hypothetical protein
MSHFLQISTKSLFFQHILCMLVGYVYFLFQKILFEQAR